MDNDDRIEHVQNLIDKADDLDSRIDAQTEVVINELVTYKNRAIKWQIATTVLMVLMLLMIIFGVLVVVKVRDNAATIKDFCQATNRSNAEQIALWDLALSIPPSVERTDEQIQRRVQLDDLIHRTFAPHNCKQPKVVP